MNELDEQSHTPLISNQSNSFYKQLFNSKRNSNDENAYSGTIGPEDDIEYDPRTPQNVQNSHQSRFNKFSSNSN